VSTDMFAFSELGVVHFALLGKENWSMDDSIAGCRGSCPSHVRRRAADRAGRPPSSGAPSTPDQRPARRFCSQTPLESNLPHDQAE